MIELTYRILCSKCRSAPPIPYRGDRKPVIWTMAGYYAGLFCRFADVRAGLYPRDGWCAADSLAVGCPQMDACAGRILRCSGGYIAGWAGCAVQSYGRAFYGVYHYRNHQSGLCGFGIDKLVQIYPSSS